MFAFRDVTFTLYNILCGGLVAFNWPKDWHWYQLYMYTTTCLSCHYIFLHKKHDVWILVYVKAPYQKLMKSLKLLNIPVNQNT